MSNDANLHATDTPVERLARDLEEIVQRLRAISASGGNHLADMRGAEAHVTGDAAESADFMLTPETLAYFLHVSLRTARRWRNEPGFPAPLRLGTVSRWRRSDIEQWIASELDTGKRPVHRRKSR